MCPFIVSIEGLAASGKTTLANYLAEIIGASVIHMDDFFLPMELRTKERMAEIGGNIHYERFKDEVIDKLTLGEDFSYFNFDCKIMNYDKKIEVKANSIYIIEGSYSRHPSFGEYADLKIFCEVSESEQIKRIKNRNGKAQLNVYKNRWIPMENRYFETFNIKEEADIVLKNFRK